MRGILIFVGALTGALGAILTTPARQVFSDGGFLNAALGLIVGAACGGLLASRLRGRSD